MYKKIVSVLLVLAIMTVALPVFDITCGVVSAASPVYRALCIGNAWPGNSIIHQKNDMTTMRDIFKKDSRYKSVYGYTNIKGKGNKISGDALLNSTATFAQLIERAYKNSKPEDINVFYYSGASARFDEPILFLADETEFSASDLKKAFDKVKGKKILILDVSFGGRFISKSENSNDFLDGFGRTLTKREGELASSNYIVLTSTSSFEEYHYWNGEDSTFGIKNRPLSKFTRILAQGLGDKSSKNRFLADTSLNGNITMNELYQYTTANALFTKPKMYPEDIGTSIIAYKTSASNTPVLTNVQVNNLSKSAPTLIFRLRHPAELQIDVIYYEADYFNDLNYHQDEVFGATGRDEYTFYEAGTHEITWEPQVDKYVGAFPYFNFAFAVKEKGSDTRELYPFVYNPGNLTDETLSVSFYEDSNGYSSGNFVLGNGKEIGIKVARGRGTVNNVAVSIYIDNDKGKRVRKLVENSRPMAESTNTVNTYNELGEAIYYWNGKNDAGKFVSSGEYTVKVAFSLNGKVKTIKQPLTVIGSALVISN